MTFTIVKEYLRVTVVTVVTIGTIVKQEAQVTFFLLFDSQKKIEVVSKKLLTGFKHFFFFLYIFAVHKKFEGVQEFFLLGVKYIYFFAFFCHNFFWRGSKNVFWGVQKIIEGWWG